MSKIPEILQSSNNPENISVTVKGLAVGLVPMIILLLNLFEIKISEIELMSFINAVATAISAIMVAFGAGRKVYNKVIK